MKEWGAIMLKDYFTLGLKLKEFVVWALFIIVLMGFWGQDIGKSIKLSVFKVEIFDVSELRTVALVIKFEETPDIIPVLDIICKEETEGREDNL